VRKRVGLYHLVKLLGAYLTPLADSWRQSRSKAGYRRATHRAPSVDGSIRPKGESQRLAAIPVRRQ
jgi:hypothetical protein